ncbi:Signal transduction histidine kinase [Actinobaculum suis]|uniref:histidine kinase n=2 Tax=Actinobaculum suis TaxID=1657 RepID=A0A1B9BEL2_9ACTO|nr:hypothetical protein ACU20_03695 [Actinobaculum suis]OCA95952.1 hypothetical protein ACU21_02725 [Actinobaculum suis]SDE50989.1 Signal transduction histidine kinase [Actinobaculum suis]VDG76994.1 sensor histidine kinase [Actinobaculum suis]
MTRPLWTASSIVDRLTLQLHECHTDSMSEWLPKLTRTRYAPIYAVGAVLLIGFDIYGHILGLVDLSRVQAGIEITLALLLALASRSILFEITFCLCVLHLKLSTPSEPGMLPLGVYLVIIIWIVRAWMLGAAILLLTVEVTKLLLTSNPTAQMFISVFLGLLAVSIGLLLRWQSARLLSAEEELENAREANAQNTRELIQELHDNTAKDLAHIILLTQDIAREHPETAPRMEALGNIATHASRRVRSIISAQHASSPPSEKNINRVVRQIQKMLATRKITLKYTLPENIENKISPAQLKGGILVLRECGSNILKYAPKHSKADLVIKFHPVSRELILSISNDVADGKPAPGVTSGFGLSNLRELVESQGGTLEAGALPGEKWLTYITLPISAENTVKTGLPNNWQPCSISLRKMILRNVEPQ